MTRHPYREAGLAIVALAWSSGCGPRINSFTVEHPVVCDGDKAVLRWDVCGEPALAVQFEPPQGGSGQCAASGRDVLAVTLVASKHGDEAVCKTEVVQLKPGAAEPVAFRPSAIDGATVVADGTKNELLWGDLAEVTSVAACDGRQLQVEHADRVAILAGDGTPSDVFSGTPLAGSWRLRSPLSAAEQATPSLRPKALELLATIRCKRPAPSKTIDCKGSAP